MARKAEPFRVQVSHFTDKHGKRCASTVKGARRSVTLTATYYGIVGGKRVSLHTSDLGSAHVELRRLLRDHLDRAAGIVTDAQDILARPLLDLVDDFTAYMASKGTSPEHCRKSNHRLRYVIEAAGWQRWQDVSKDTLLAALRKLREPGIPRKKRKGISPGRPGGVNLSAQTSNHYRTITLGWSAWLADRAGVRDPLHRAPGHQRIELDRRHPRRCPTDEEIRQLFDFLDSGRADGYRGLSGPQRALGYRVCMATGLRAKELRSLTRESFDLAEGTVTVQAAYSKHRREDVLPLPMWLVAQLKAWFKAGGECWGNLRRVHPGKSLKRDLRGAGIPYETKDGFFDMHALRVYYCTALANLPDISPKTLMTLCRHSDPKLTLSIYARARTKDLAEAVDQIPDLTKRKKK